MSNDNLENFWRVAFISLNQINFIYRKILRWTACKKLNIFYPKLLTKFLSHTKNQNVSIISFSNPNPQLISMAYIKILARSSERKNMNIKFFKKRKQKTFSSSSLHEIILNSSARYALEYSENSPLSTSVNYNSRGWNWEAEKCFVISAQEWRGKLFHIDLKLFNDICCFSHWFMASIVFRVFLVGFYVESNNG
jgi:hypothetical protein